MGDWERFSMRKFVLAALVALSGAGTAVAGDFIVPVDKDFIDGDITWDSQERAYEFKWAVRENKSGLYVCGVGKFTDAGLKGISMQALRKAKVSIDGTPILKDIAFFNKIKKGEDLNAAKATCRQTAVRSPKNAKQVSIDFTGRYRD